ncbi:MAG: TlpA family protein disulfide reductase, partial [Gammaproteobacteria bacterium]|nr:TlpA family protein disulfide reductase [Gammaproteobacteria bacterium]
AHLRQPFACRAAAIVSALLGTLLMGSLLLACSRDSGRDHQFSLAKYEGKWVILNYWADWCAPCIEEIPELNQLQQSYANELVVLGVNFDKVSGAQLQAQAEQMQIEFTLVDPDPAHILRLSRPAALPTTYIFDREGRLSAKLVGPQTAASLLARIKLLAAKAG